MHLNISTFTRKVLICRIKTRIFLNLIPPNSNYSHVERHIGRIYRAISYMIECSHLHHVRFEEESHPVGVVVHGEVRQPGAGVGVHHDLVTSLHVHDDVLASHAVLVVVLVVLVEDGGDLLAVLPDGEQGLLVVVGGDVELEEVDPAHRTGEDPGVDVQTSTYIAVSPVEGQVLLTTAIIRLVSKLKSLFSENTSGFVQKYIPVSPVEN